MGCGSANCPNHVKWINLWADTQETDLETLPTNAVIEGDCLEVLPNIPDESVDLVLCDLPYGTTQNCWDSVIPLDRLWQEYERIIKPRGVIALTAQGLFTARLILSNERLFRYKIAWVKSKPTNFLNARRQPLRQHEDICIFYKQQPAYHPQMQPGDPYNKGIRKNQHTGSYGRFSPVRVASDGGRFPTDVVYFKTAESEGQVVHATQKPLALGQYLIRTFTNKQAVVLDNACGSGSFLVAAAMENRDFIGIEKNQEVHLFKEGRIDYMQVISERLCDIGCAPRLLVWRDGALLKKRIASTDRIWGTGPLLWEGLVG